jgi:hypothetical protein
LEEHGTWVEVPIMDAKAKILPSTWVLQLKTQYSFPNQAQTHLHLQT